MNIDDSFNCKIGEVVSGFIRTEFIISSIVYELELNEKMKTRYPF